MKTKTEIINLIMTSTKKEVLFDKLKKGDIHYFEDLIKQNSGISENDIYYKQSAITTKVIKVLKIKFKPSDPTKFCDDLKPFIDNGLKKSNDIKGFLGHWIDNMVIECDAIYIETNSSLNKSIKFELIKIEPLEQLIDKRYKLKKSIMADNNDSIDLVTNNISLFIDNTKDLIGEVF